MNNLSNNYQFDAPSVTVDLLDELKSMGLTDEAFAIIHHFERPESITRHRNYCLSKGHFRTEPNRLVQRRLKLIERILTMANIKKRNARMFKILAKLAILEFPHANKGAP